MDDELWMLHDAMVVKDRLRVLAQVQSTYVRELVELGFEQSLAEQLMVEWSRHAFAMTIPVPSEHGRGFDLHELAASLNDESTRRIVAEAAGEDPSSVPKGEPWLQLVEDLDELDRGEDAPGDDLAA
jgi:hypothetical protein